VTPATTAQAGPAPAERVHAALLRHPGVRCAAVTTTRDDNGRDRMVAYLVTDPAWPAGSGAAAAGTRTREDELVRRWQAIWDLLYAGPDAADASFDIRGWTDSRTRELLPEAEMRDWLDRTVDAVAALRPRRMLEIGCGSGLLLHRLAPRCDAYWATDFCARALDRIAVQLPGRGLRDRTHLLHRTAYDLSGVPGGLDCVVLNSVVQYFPTVDYVARVLHRAVDLVRPGGAVFVGDAYSLPLAEAFHASVVVHRAAPDTDRATLVSRTHQRVAAQAELTLAPQVFATIAARIPRVSRVDVRPKLGRHTNELTAYRYDVVLRLDGARPTPSAVNWVDWGAEGLDLGTVSKVLRRGAVPVLAVSRVPNARVGPAVRVWEAMRRAHGPATAAALRESGDGGTIPDGVTADDLAGCAAGTGYTTRLSWLAGYPDGAIDALWSRSDVADDEVSMPCRALSAPLSNDPLRARYVETLTRDVAAFLRGQLPGHPLPESYRCVDRLPATLEGAMP
jgi:SAM-dependent methyltransferase